MRLLKRILGTCGHRRTTFPQKARGADAPHVTCLDCGREFEYDWSEMRRVDGRKRVLGMTLGDLAAHLFLWSVAGLMLVAWALQ